MRGEIELMIRHLEPLREEMIKDARFEEAALLRDVISALEKEALRAEALRAVMGIKDLVKLEELKRTLIIPAIDINMRPKSC